MKIFLAAASALALAACAVIPVTTDRSARGAEAQLADPSGRAIARATFDDVGTSIVRLRLTATGLRPGTYGAHVHAVGRCDAPDFTTAGSHWNPESREHGRDNPAGAHVGDLPNIVVRANGRGTLDARIAGASLRGGANPIFDADGSALLIHANADDYRTDPSGNSGGRIACGVIR